MVDSGFQGPYKFVCAERPPDYSYYQKYEIACNDMSAYHVQQKLGRGKYSEVYQGVNILNNQPCVVKILKPVRTEKIYREIKILQTLYGGPNIVKLYDVLKDPQKNQALVFEYIPNIETKQLNYQFDRTDIQLYTYKILQALEYAHTHGIMHRDVKPLNIVIDHEKRDLRLIDWGLGEYYHPDQEYNVRVASRYYKGPELLVDDRLYHYSLDIWSLGCTLAGMLFRIDTMFKGSDNFDQLVKITKVLGTQKLMDYVKNYSLTVPKEAACLLKNTEPVPWTSFVNEKNHHRITPEGLDLLDKMLQYDKNKRITPAEAMQHPYFASIRKMLE
jgi:casein kinase II subunit alpha